MGTAATGRNAIVISALRARANFGKLLEKLENERQSLVIEKRGRPRAVLLSIAQYAKLAAPEPEVLKVLGEESKRNKTDALSSRRIEQIISAARSRRKRR
jgi:prevent-host-death family protein